MKSKLKVAFVNFWPEIVDEDIFTPILSKHYDVELDYTNPDIVFHSIFGDLNLMNRFQSKKKILFLGENRRPNEFKSDFSISFDPHSETNFRLPLWQYFILLKPIYLELLMNKVKWDSFDRFCSFTVSNGSNFMRNGIMESLQKYRGVHSYGRFQTNSLELQNLSQGKYWRDAKLEFFTKIKHKFSIAYENTSYPGYCTEKLMDAFLGGSLPIYWGDFKAKQEFNENSFINAFKYSGNDLVEYIKYLDNSKDAYMKHYNEPVFTLEQLNELNKNLNNFENWLLNRI